MPLAASGSAKPGPHRRGQLTGDRGDPPAYGRDPDGASSPAVTHAPTALARGGWKVMFVFYALLWTLVTQLLQHVAALPIPHREDVNTDSSADSCQPTIW